jgi:hypothetical protein
MADGLLSISQAGMIRFAKVVTSPPDGLTWENTLVCQEVNPDGKRYGYAQKWNTADVIKVYFKSAYTTHAAQLHDNLNAHVGGSITPTLEIAFPLYSYYSITLDTASWDTAKAYYLLLVATDGTYDTQTYQSEPMVIKASWANHVIIRYTNYDTAFELPYASFAINHYIRVPGRIYGYKPEGQIEVYSNQGVLTKISEVVERVQTLEIDPVPKYLAEKINIALAHDLISVNGTEFVKKAVPNITRFSKTNMMTVTAELTQSYVSGLNSDDEGFDYVGSGGDAWETVKNFTLTGVTGAQSIDVGAYATTFRINDIVFKLLGGVGGTNKAGLTAGGVDVIEETDMSDLVIGNPVSVYCGKVFGYAQDTVYLTLAGAGATYDINLTLIRYKV